MRSVRVWWWSLDWRQQENVVGWCFGVGLVVLSLMRLMLGGESIHDYPFD